MLTEPELLLLDEPMSSLDVESSLEMLQLLRRLAEHSGVTIVFSTHQLHRIEQLCDRVALLDKGHFVNIEAVSRTFSFDTKQVEVILDGPEGAAKKLREQPWVSNVEIKHGRLVVTLEGETPHQLNTFLVNAGYKVDVLMPRRRTLREYAWRTAQKISQGSAQL
jgi:ABC-2 type transport system ATP-binding protein